LRHLQLHLELLLWQSLPRRFPLFLSTLEILGFWLGRYEPSILPIVDVDNCNGKHYCNRDQLVHPCGLIAINSLGLVRLTHWGSCVLSRIATGNSTLKLEPSASLLLTEIKLWQRYKSC
jgi:hypothetical protein